MTKRVCRNYDGCELCKTYNRAKLAKWRATASKQEKKARSLQIAFKSGTRRTLTLAEARQLIANPPSCPYCKQPIPWQQLSIDHRLPTSRGGDGTPENIVWVDLSCNIMKGNLLDTEFVTLLEFLADKPEMLKILRTRLKGGGFMYRRAGG